MQTDSDGCQKKKIIFCGHFSCCSWFVLLADEMKLKGGVVFLILFCIGFLNAVHHCIHDQHLKDYNTFDQVAVPNVVDSKTQITPNNTLPNNFPIRIFFNTSFLTTDKYACFSTGAVFEKTRNCSNKLFSSFYPNPKKMFAVILIKIPVQQ